MAITSSRISWPPAGMRGRARFSRVFSPNSNDPFGLVSDLYSDNLRRIDCPLRRGSPKISGSQDLLKSKQVMTYRGLLESPYPHVSKRKFAELPFSKTWPELLARVEQMDGAWVTRFTTDERDNWLVFDYGAYEFCMHDYGSIVQFTVNDFDCPETLLNNVLRYFSEYLSPAMGD